MLPFARSKLSAPYRSTPFERPVTIASFLYARGPRKFHLVAARRAPGPLGDFQRFCTVSMPFVFAVSEMCQWPVLWQKLIFAAGTPLPPAVHIRGRWV